MSGNAFGCIVWCPKCLYQSSRPWKLSPSQQWPFPHAHSTTTFQDANDWAELCHTPQLSWAGQSWWCFRYPQWQHQLHLQTHSHASWRSPGNNYSWGFLRVKTLMLRWTCAWILVAHQSSYRIQVVDVAGLLPRQWSLLHLWQVSAWFYGKGWSLSVWLLFSWLVQMRWLSRFLDHVLPRSRLNARTYSRVLSPSASGSGLPYPIPPCTSLYLVPARPTWPFQSPHGSEIQILRSWQSQYPADQRTGP